MRQRITKQASRRDSGVWDNSEDEGDSQTGMSYHQAVPMYNPQHYQQQSVSMMLPGNVHDETSNNKNKRLHSGALSPFADSTTGDLPSLAPAFIPDSSYQTYLNTGGRISRNRAKGNLFFSKVCCAKFCAVYSFVALGFLLFVGILFDNQPLYIPGSLPKHMQYTEGSSTKTQTFYSITPSVRLTPASNAYGAALLYLTTGCFCVAYAYDFINCYRRKSYEEIPDTDSMVPNFHVSPRSSSGSEYVLPMMGGGISNRKRSYYERGTIPDSSFVENMKSTYNRATLYLASVLPVKDNRRGRRRKVDPKDV